MAKGKEQKNNLQTRPPVVVVLGHVDHGKSSLLEAIKDLKITVKESGGITQHIGAYEIEHKGKQITFIDTPGHEAFSAMRSRGAKVADIAVLVIAAEDGVKEQTKEAISHIKKAGIPMIVAINKIDKPEANPEKVKRELSSEDILVESMGGKIPSVEVSAKTGKGIPELLEIILLVAEIEDLKGDISKPAEGAVVESYLDSKKGAVATLLLRNGILKKGDILGTSFAVGKVRILEDFQGNSIEKALPSMPVIVLGFEDVPWVGDKFKAYNNLEEARENLEKEEASLPEPIVLEPDKKILNLVLKVDVLGSLEAIEEILKNLKQEEVVLRILKAEVGDINESDVKLAEGAKAKIVGFRVKADTVAKKLASRLNISIMKFDVIYELVQAVREFFKKMKEPKEVRVDLGEVEILEIFLIDKKRQIIGGKVKSGEIERGARVEVYRKKEKAGEGKIAGLKRGEKDVQSVKEGSECGLLFEGDVKIEQGDWLKVYKKEKKKIE